MITKLKTSLDQFYEKWASSVLKTRHPVFGRPDFGHLLKSMNRPLTKFNYFQVFRDLIKKCNIARPGEMEAIFSNVTDITELTMTLIGSLEDTLEMTEEGNSPGNNFD